MDYARTMCRIFIIAAIVMSLAANAFAAQRVYRSVDEEGNVIFSDQETPGSEPVDIQETQTIESPRLPSFRYTEPPETAPYYTSLVVVSPRDDESVRNNAGNVTIRVNVAPRLLRGDSLIIRMDGKEVSSGGTSVSLENVDRGTHTVQAVIKGSNGEVRKTFDTIKFHLLRHSIQHPPPGGPPPP